ncbi:MAG: DUF6474 family protein [Corynebacterium sp.]|nr:DUF6474 family protein [Corynebacterium sp.]
MSIIKKLKKARKQAKADLKAAKTRVKAEVKSAAKAAERREKLLAKQEKQLLKAEEKGLKNRRKHEYKLAKAQLEAARQGKFNRQNVQRYAGATRALLPLALPLIYRAIISGRQQLESRRAHKAGVNPGELAAFGGHGAPLKARTHKLRNTLVTSDKLPSGFKGDVRDRLDELDAAIENSELMSVSQRKRAHESISADINLVAQEVQDRLLRK